MASDYRVYRVAKNFDTDVCCWRKRPNQRFLLHLCIQGLAHLRALPPDGHQLHVPPSLKWMPCHLLHLPKPSLAL